MDGDVYIFINSRRTMLKLFKWEKGGFIQYYKRLEKGTYEKIQTAEKKLTVSIDYEELVMLITGISLKNTRKRARFYQQQNVYKTQYTSSLSKPRVSSFGT